MFTDLLFGRFGRNFSAAAVLAASLTLAAAPAHAQLLEQGDRPGIARAVDGGCQQRAITADAVGLLDTISCTAWDFVTAANLPPSPVRELTYSETPEFNIALHRSLKARHRTVTVNVPGDALPLSELDIERPYPDSPAMAFWLGRIAETGGTNTPCSEPVPGAIFGILDFVARYMSSELRQWITYRPASRYNSRIDYVAGTEGPFVARTITFVRRNRPEPTCGTVIGR